MESRDLVWDLATIPAAVVAGTTRGPTPRRPRAHSFSTLARLVATLAHSVVALAASVLRGTEPTASAGRLNQTKSRGASVRSHKVAGLCHLSNLALLLVSQNSLDLFLLPLPPSGEFFPALVPFWPLSTDLANLLDLLFSETELLHDSFGE